VEQIPAVAYIHPIWQLAALALGLYIAAVSLPSIGNMNFKVRPHERLGRIFLIVVFAGVVFGKLVSASLPARMFSVPGHGFLSVLIIALVVLGAIFGYQGGRLRLRVRTGMMQLHPWLIVLAVALMIAQALLGLSSKGLRLIKF
jgi:hypothetical protein